MYSLPAIGTIPYQVGMLSPIVPSQVILKMLGSFTIYAGIRTMGTGNYMSPFHTGTSQFPGLDFFNIR